MNQPIHLAILSFSFGAAENFHDMAINEARTYIKLIMV